MSTYTVRAVRWERGWELHIEGVGVTQSHGLRDAEAMIRDYLRLDDNKDWETADIDLGVDLDGLEKDAEQVREEIAALAEEQERVARHARHLAHRLRDAGLSGADASAVMQVSPQRYSQLVNTGA